MKENEKIKRKEIINNWFFKEDDSLLLYKWSAFDMILIVLFYQWKIITSVWWTYIPFPASGVDKHVLIPPWFLHQESFLDHNNVEPFPPTIPPGRPNNFAQNFGWSIRSLETRSMVVYHRALTKGGLLLLGCPLPWGNDLSCWVVQKQKDKERVRVGLG